MIRGSFAFQPEFGAEIITAVEAMTQRIFRARRTLLSYHVVAERLTSETVGGRNTRPESANGYRLTVDGRDGLRVNDELVVMPDITASNGIIQGINAVLSPPVLVAHSGANSGR